MRDANRKAMFANLKKSEGIIIKKLPREKTRFGKETGRVRIKFSDGSIKDSPVALLKARDSFYKLSLKDMEKSNKKPYLGRRLGEKVEISNEKYWD